LLLPKCVKLPSPQIPILPSFINEDVGPVTLKSPSFLQLQTPTPPTSLPYKKSNWKTGVYTMGAKGKSWGDRGRLFTFQRDLL